MAKTLDLTPPCAFPVPEFTNAQVILGAPASAYLTREQLGDWMRWNSTPFHKAVSGLFFRGGSLEQYGLRFKPEIDKAKAMAAIRALLGSFEPKHEIKEATVAVALANWCDISDPEKAGAA